MELYGRVRLLFYFWHWIFRTECMIHLENNVQTESPVPRDLAFQSSSHTLMLLFRGLSSETTALELVIWLNIRITFLFGSYELVFGQGGNTCCFLSQFQVWKQSIKKRVKIICMFNSLLNWSFIMLLFLLFLRL